MINGHAAHFKSFWIENDKGLRGTGIFLAGKWIETVANTSRVSDRTIAMKVLFRHNAVSVNSVYAPWFDLDENQRDDILDCVKVVAGSFRERLVNVIIGDFKGHVEVSADYENQQGGNGVGVRNKEGERILEFYAAIYMTVRNTLFKKRKIPPSLIVGLTETQLNYCFIKGDQRKFVKNKKVLPTERYITQRKRLVCDLKIRKVKETKRKFVPRRKIETI